MVSSQAGGTDTVIWLTALSGAVFLLLIWLSGFLRRTARRLLEAQHRVPYHSGGGLWPVLLEKLSALLKIAAYLSALLSAALLLFRICR